jgi:acyl carrier protein
MNDAEALALIKGALTEVAPEQRGGLDGLTLDSEIKDLGIDSIRTLEMVGSIEDHLARIFDEQELARVKTLGDLVTLIRDGRVGT